MPAYSFQKQFVPFVESGAKTHTIRGKRKARPRPGQPFHGYYGMRTKQCRKIIESVITSVQDITIDAVVRPAFVGKDDEVDVSFPRIVVDGKTLCEDEMEALAQRDGFADLYQMFLFWYGRLPFSGDIIHWKPVANG